MAYDKDGFAVVLGKPAFLSIAFPVIPPASFAAAALYSLSLSFLPATLVILATLFASIVIIAEEVANKSILPDELRFLFVGRILRYFNLTRNPFVLFTIEET